MLGYGTIAVAAASLLLVMRTHHTSVRARHVSFESCDGQNGTVACDQSSRAPLLATDTWQVRWASAAMMKTLPDETDMMPGLGPVPLLQRQSASESRWTWTVLRHRSSRESARKIFPNRPYLYLTKMEAALCSSPAGRLYAIRKK